MKRTLEQVKADIFDLKQVYLNDRITTNQFCDDLIKLNNELNSFKSCAILTTNQKN